MIKKSMALFSALLILIVAGFSTRLFSFPGGAPAARTGSPADVKTCTACHSATVIKKEGMITTNAADNFYVPGQSYTITASASGTSNAKKIGFEVSPQSATGALMGQMSLINKEETQLVGKGKYITHTAKGCQASGSKSWSFKWVAPAAGSGDVTFYGAFLISDLAQLVFTSSLTLKEKTN